MEAAIPLCHVVEKFDEAFNTVGYIVASAENGFRCLHLHKLIVNIKPQAINQTW